MSKTRVWVLGVVLSAGCSDPQGLASAGAPAAGAPAAGDAVAIHHASMPTAAQVLVPQPSNEPRPLTQTPPVTDADPTWCAGHATTKIALAANLDPESVVPELAFGPQDPSSTANFSTSVTVYDAWGRPAQLDIYFATTAYATWDAHVILNAAQAAGAQTIGLELGTASVSFEGARREPEVYVGSPVHLAAPVGFESPEIALDFSKLTFQDAPYSVTARQNGNAAAFSSDCSQVVATDAGPSGPESLRAAPLVDLPACLTGETRSFYVAVNFMQTGYVPEGAFWNADTPLQLPVRDSLGRASTLFMYFRSAGSDSSSWTYRVFGAPDSASPLLGAGELSFNPNGTLKRVAVSKALQFVEPDSQSLDLGLDFGQGTDLGGGGVDGSTAFATSPQLVNLSVRGAGPGLGSPCVSSTLLRPVMNFAGATNLAQPATRSVTAWGILPPSTPLQTDAFDPSAAAQTSSVAVSQTIYDAHGWPWTLNLYARHVTPHQWQYTYIANSQLTSASTSNGFGLLEFDDRGLLVSATPPGPLRLPMGLGDDSPGPLIDLPAGATIDDGAPGSDWFLGIENEAPVLDLQTDAQQASAR